MWYRYRLRSNKEQPGCESPIHQSHIAILKIPSVADQAGIPDRYIPHNPAQLPASLLRYIGPCTQTAHFGVPSLITFQHTNNTDRSAI